MSKHDREGNTMTTKRFTDTGMSGLDAIRARVTAHREHGTPGLAAPRDRAQLLDAVDAVRAVHEPVDALMYGAKNAHKVQVCTGCGQDDGNWNRWPCPTVRAIEKAVTA